MTNGYRLVDHYFIQDVSTAAQAAIGSSTFVVIAFFAGFELLAAGAGPIIARTTGAGNLDRRRRAVGGGLVGALALSGAAMLIGGLGAPFIGRSLGLTGQTHAELCRYLSVLSWTILPLALTPLVDQAFISMGSARAPMLLHALSLALNIVLTPLLIHQAGLGVAGAALASNASRLVSTGIGLFILARQIDLKWRDITNSRELGNILRLGTPIAIGTLTYALVYWGLLLTSVSRLGPHVNAALGIGFSVLEGVTWPIFLGLSLAVSSFVGRELGAGRPEEARRAAKLGTILGTVLGVAATLVFWLGGHGATALFTSDPRVHEEATRYAMVLAASQLFVAYESVFEGVLAGAGDTKTVFWMSAPLNLIRVPLAWWFAFPVGMGAAGVWWAINLTTYAKAGAKGWATIRGKWASIEV